MSETIGQRRLMAPWCATGAAVATVGLGWVFMAAFWAPPGVLNVDGVIYRAMIDAFLRNGSLFVENGYDFYPSPDLMLEYLVVSGDKLAPQYPGGWGILAAPAYLAGGVQGVIVVNAVASALTLIMTWLAAEALFGNRRIASAAALIYALATFAVDYALAFWPHASTTFLVTAAFAAVARGWRAGERDETRGFLVAGLAIGLAVHIRVDAILAVGGLGIWMMAAANRPYRGLVLFLLGLAPGLAAATAINYVKFGRLSPITYGKSSGNASLASYAELLPAIGLAGLAVVALGAPRARAVAFQPRMQAALLMAGAALLAVVPELGAQVWRVAQGIYVLVIDFQAHPFPGWGLTMTDQGILLAWNLNKKALLQSLPYAAGVMVLVPRLVRGPDRAALSLCLLFALPFVAFFSFAMWHGGSNNMRYFLNFVPVMAILSAVALREITQVPGRSRVVALTAAAMLLAGVVLYAVRKNYSIALTVERMLPTAIVFAVAAGSIVMMLSRARLRAVAASALKGLFVLGLVTAFFSAWVFDVWVGRKERQLNVELNQLADTLPADALVMTLITSHAGFRVNRAPAITAKADHVTGEFDIGLIRHAFHAGRPVYAQGKWVSEAMIEVGVASTAKPTFGIEDRHEFYRMAPPTETPAAGGSTR